MKLKQYLLLSLMSATLLLLTGCGGDEENDSTNNNVKPPNINLVYTQEASPQNPDPKTTGEGYYLDAAVEGLSYYCGKYEGVTNEKGRFWYEKKHSCSFYIGKLHIRTIPASKLKDNRIVIQESDPKVAQLLLTLNSNSNRSHIQIDATLSRTFNDDTYYKQSIQDADLHDLIEHTKEQFAQQGITLALTEVSENDAKAHIKESYTQSCGQQNFLLSTPKKADFLPQCPHQEESSDNIDTAIPTTQTPTTNTPPKNNTKKHYAHLPSKKEISDAMAVKFLNMATFGATQTQVEELKNMGIEAWVDHYLNMPYDAQQDSLLRKVIKRCTDIDYHSYDSTKHTVDEWLGTGITYRNQLRFFNQRKINGIHEIDHHFSLLFDQQIRGRNQLRQRVAYALSQLIIASESNDNFFHERGEALSYYYDLLMKHAFGKYRDLLYDVSLSPTMATFLTYASNPKAFVDPETNSTILPDENYGREIMQLFTIGLYQLNMDGTQIRENGQRVPTYTQEDVNNMSRVFTGLYYNNSQWGDTTFAADMTHPLACNQAYHDSEPKEVLGITLQGSDDCMQEVAAAVDMLMTHPNVAPFVAKKLILRLTKSNPTTAYVQRVAEVFAATQGDLKATIKAILLDEEIWKDIKEDRGTKIKEPYLAFTQMVRALEYKPVPSFYWTIPSNKSETQTIENPGFILDAYTRFPLYAYFGEFPTQSPSVFNFYDDAFQPDDDEFKIRGFVAPEIEIVTPKYAVAYNNFVSLLLYEASVPRVLERYGSSATPENNPKAYHASRTYMYQEYTEALPIAETNHFYDGLSKEEKTKAREKIATALVDLYSQKLLGKKLDSTQRQAIIEYYTKLNRWSNQNKDFAYKRREFIQFFVRPIILDILHTDTYMVN